MAELYTFLTSVYLPTRFPSIFAISSNRLHNLVSGATYPATPEPCAASILRTLGELVDEDFMFLVPDNRGALTLQGYVSCFASGFAMNGIFGKDLDGIHLEVPGYRENIERSMKRWFTKLEAGNIWRRTNVSHDPRSFRFLLFVVLLSALIGRQWTITLHGHLRSEHGQNQVYESKDSASRICTSFEESPIDISNVSCPSPLSYLGLSVSMLRKPPNQSLLIALGTLAHGTPAYLPPSKFASCCFQLQNSALPTC